MTPISLRIPRKLLREFRFAAEKSFPIETAAFFIGQDVTTGPARRITAKEIWFPPEIWDTEAKEPRKSPLVSDDSAAFPPKWFLEAEEAAHEIAMGIVAVIHSHPYSWKEMQGWRRLPDCSESERDQDYFCHWGRPTGICTITETKTGKKRARFRFWGPRTGVALNIKGS